MLRKALAFLTLAAGIAFPFSARAGLLFSPFGGKVESWNLACIKEITLPVFFATGFTTLVTVEELKVGKPTSATVGLLRVDFIPVPNPNAMKRNFGYFVPTNNVLGTSIDLCSICNVAKEAREKVGGEAGESVKKFCDSLPIVGELLKTVCSAASVAGCPVTNLVYHVGSGSPLGVVAESAEKTAQAAVSKLCTTALNAIPLVGSLLADLCP